MLDSRRSSYFKNSQRFTLFCGLITALSVNSTQAAAIVQPVGNLIQDWNPTLVNQYLAKWDPNIVPGVTDPFDTHYAVTEIQPTQDQYFVRVYAGPSDNGAVGTYIVRSQFIRGLSPEQIKNLLALPTLPNKLAYVKVPAGSQYGLWTGIAGPINTPAYPYGNGGGQQTKIIGRHVNSTPPADPANFANYTYVPVVDYLNPEYIGASALSYAQTVSSGNAGKIAAYLDKFIPQPYSDMESVYTTLDFVNWMNNNKALTQSLNQISPDNYDAISTIAFRDYLFFNNILLNHSQGASQNINMRYLAPATTQTEHRGLCQSAWGNVSGEQGEESISTNRVGFRYQTAAATTGIDCEIRPNFRVGIGAGYISSNIGWSQSRGSAQMNMAEAGLYSGYFTPGYFVKAALTTGYDWTSAQRNIHITGIGYGLQFVGGQAIVSGPSDYLSINRSANSDQSGESIGLQFLGGKNFQYTHWNLLPTAKISYFYSQQNAFKESGANSLNLNVGNVGAQTLRTELAVLLGKDFTFKKDLTINGNIQFGWAHTMPIVNRSISANLAALGGSFTVNGYHEQTNSLLASLGFTAKIDKRLWIDGRYNADLSHGFNEQMIGLLFRYALDA
ncbi:MAG: autotransporter outer membrane beta-barrel domain-containing protein [Gammaproteobacteria bacterium]|nr:autotransporter outer membrane beta-barrel domain-containing protein [Gammaproteobacteria bacterium]